MHGRICVRVCVRVSACVRGYVRAYLTRGNQNGSVGTQAQGWVQNLTVLLFLLLVWMGIT